MECADFLQVFYIWNTFLDYAPRLDCFEGGELVPGCFLEKKNYISHDAVKQIPPISRSDIFSSLEKITSSDV